VIHFYSFADSRQVPSLAAKLHVPLFLPRSGRGMQPGTLVPGILGESNFPLYSCSPSGAEEPVASTLTNLLYHLVFSTKHREPIITAPIRADLYAYIGGIVRGEGGVLLEIGGMPDHVHLVTRFKSEPSVATMLKKIKSKSSQACAASRLRRARRVASS